MSDNDREVAKIDEQVFHEREMLDNDREVAHIEEFVIARRCISIAPRYLPLFVAEERSSTS